MPGPDDVRRALDFARNYPPKPYVWGGCAASGCDCSGMMSAWINVIMGRTPWVRLFGTGNLPDVAARVGLKPGLGDSGDLNLGVMYPSESSSGIGHTAGTLEGVNLESRGGLGALVGPAARGATNSLFAHHWHLPIDTGTPKGWWEMSIPATELAKIQAAAVAAVASAEGKAAVRAAAVSALNEWDSSRPPNLSSDPNNHPLTLTELLGVWGGGAVAMNRKLDALVAAMTDLGRRLAALDPNAFGRIVQDAVSQALIASPVEVGEDDVRMIAEQVATITGERLLHPSAGN